MGMVISQGKITKPKRTVIYGVEGIGKSTLASKFPDPLFIDTEGSTYNFDVKRMEKPKSWNYLFEQIKYVIQNKPCKTLIIDTMDWAEQLAVNHVCSIHGKNGIEDFGYGKGHIFVKEEVGKLLNLLSEVIENGMNVVLTAHSQIRKFEQPNEMGAYDRYELKLGQKTSSQTAPLVKEWADMVLFLNYKTFAVASDDKGKKFKAQGGKRVMYTSHHPCWDAKNRYGLPDECELSYEVIRPIIEDNSYSQKKEPERHVQDNHVSEEESWLPQDAQNEPVSDEKTTALDFTEGEYRKLPVALVELMKNSSISVEKLKQAIAKKGFFPANTPLENIPIDFWNMTVANWKNFEEFIINMDIQF